MKQTRLERALELEKKLTRGPSYSLTFEAMPITEQRLSERYQLWAETWILPELLELVPELRKRG